MKLYRIIILFCLLFTCTIIFAQVKMQAVEKKSIKDSLPKKITIPDTAAKPKHNPRIATKRSAIIPGWGQAYNKEYWKIPIVYGAIAIPTVTFFYNNTWYKRTKTAYDLTFKAQDTPRANNQDTANLANINPKLQGLRLGSLQTYRNSFRKDRDFSLLWFLILWGLNVVDATVFGHLKGFDVSDNLSMKIKPTINPLTKSNGVGLVFNLKKPTQKIITTR